jgi:pimeloyl-ACP methyl ester carboxylesterase
VGVAKLSDGRQLGYALMGVADGFPIVALHGTPGSARQLASLDRRVGDLGVFLIAPDRPGYGESTYDPHRTIASGARDVAELLDQLDVGRCGIVGLSGGGPTALACAALLSDRITAVATVGGVAPLVPRDPTLPPDRSMVRLARRSRPVTRLIFEGVFLAGRLQPERMLARFAGLLARSDAALLREDLEVRSAFLDDFRHSSRTAAQAVTRDLWLFGRPWDVDGSRADTTIHVWHGTEDRNVPFAHAGVIAARFPRAELHVVEGGGHLLVGQMEAIVAGVR